MLAPTIINQKIHASIYIKPKAIFLFIFLIVLVLELDAKPITSIEITGLNAVSRGVVLNYIPIEVGDELGAKDSSNDVIKALYQTGLFDDISVLIEGQIVKIHLTEKPHIRSISITGYSETVINKETLNKLLRSIKLIEGEIFVERTLNQLIEQIKKSYEEKGYYAAQVKKNIEQDEQNRIIIKVEIEENDVLRVRSLKIKGNTAYEKEELLDLMSIGEPDFFIMNYFTEKDHYSKIELDASLANIKSLYINSGYIEFKVEKVDTKLSEDGKYIDIEVDIFEGEQYRISDIYFSGDTPFYESSEVKELLTFKIGDIFKQKDLVKSMQKIGKLYTKKGYAFIAIEPKTNIDSENKTIIVDFPIILNQRVYVNRILIEGNFYTQDEVVRREIKQAESSLYSSKAIDESVSNLKRLGYFSAVRLQVEKVADTNDQVNLIFLVTETKTGNFTVGLSHSNDAGVSANVGVSEKNFLGTGNTLNLTLAQSKSVKKYSFSFVDPYFTDNKNSISYGFSYHDVDASELSLSDYHINTISGHLGYGIPLSEYSNLDTTFSVAQLDISCGGSVGTNAASATGFTRLEMEQCASDNDKEVKVNFAWRNNTLDNYYNPTSGVHSLISLDIALPVADFRYIKLNLKNDFYHALNKTFTLQVKGKLGIAKGYGGKPLPFFKRYYGGGGDSIRGFKFNTLGELYPGTNKARGGELSVFSSIAIIAPISIIKDNKNIRISTFIDLGSIYNEISDFALNDLRASVGIALSWVTPIGPLGIVYATPISKKDGDTIDKFDFRIGYAF